MHRGSLTIYVPRHYKCFSPSISRIWLTPGCGTWIKKEWDVLQTDDYCGVRTYTIKLELIIVFSWYFTFLFTFGSRSWTLNSNIRLLWSVRLLASPTKATGRVSISSSVWWAYLPHAIKGDWFQSRNSSLWCSVAKRACLLILRNELDQKSVGFVSAFQGRF